MDRYSIIEAHFWFCADYHEGQGSRLYRRLSKISSYYRPGACQTGPEPGSEAELIYQSLATAEEERINARKR